MQAPNLRPAELCSVLASLWVLAPGHPEASPLASTLLTRWSCLLPSLAPEDLCQSLWALRALRWRVPEPLLRTALDAVGASLDLFCAGDLALVAWALARLDAAPSRAWGDAFLRVSEHRLRELEPSDCAQLLWALARLQLRPHDAWLRAFCAHTAPLLHRFSKRELMAVVGSLAMLRAQPGGAWLRHAQHAIEARRAEFAPRQAEYIAFAFARVVQTRHSGIALPLAAEFDEAAIAAAESERLP